MCFLYCNLRSRIHFEKQNPGVIFNRIRQLQNSRLTCLKCPFFPLICRLKSLQNFQNWICFCLRGSVFPNIIQCCVAITFFLFHCVIVTLALNVIFPIRLEQNSFFCTTNAFTILWPFQNKLRQTFFQLIHNHYSKIHKHSLSNRF